MSIITKVFTKYYNSYYWRSYLKQNINDNHTYNKKNFAKLNKSMPTKNSPQVNHFRQIYEKRPMIKYILKKLNFLVIILVWTKITRRSK